jgi:hypothetical protein
VDVTIDCVCVLSRGSSTGRFWCALMANADVLRTLCTMTIAAGYTPVIANNNYNDRWVRSASDGDCAREEFCCPG